MSQSYTLREAARELKADYKTLRNWLKEAGIELHPDAGDKRLKLLTREQVEQLAVLHKRTIAPVTPPDDPLAALEQRLRAYVKQEITAQVGALRADILTRLEALEAPSAPPQLLTPAPAPVATVTTVRSSPLSERPASKVFRHSWEVKDWLQGHGVAPVTMVQWAIPARAMETREGALIFAKTYGASLRRCADDACPCHDVLD